MGTPTMQIERITPAMARKWLEDYNNTNRPLRKGRVEALATDIKEGRWFLDGSAIRFNGDGSLLDGQHRLSAIVVAKKPVRTFVVRGIDKDSMTVIDSGAKRTLGDYLRIEGYKSTALLAGIVNWCMRYETGTLRFNQCPSHAAAIAWFNPRAKELEALTTVCHAMAHTSLKMQASAMGGIIYESKSQGAARAFFERVVEGADLHRLSPEYALRKWWETELARNTKSTRFVRSAVMVKAWNHHVLGNDVRLLRFNSQEEFPEILRAK